MRRVWRNSMMNWFARFLLLGALAQVVSVGPARAASGDSETSLVTAMQKAETESPLLKSQKYRVQASAEEVRTQKSSYMPEVSAAAIASDGAPGAFSYMGVDSNYSSSQRMGVGGALILKQDIWDFGRTGGAVQAAQAQSELARKQIALSRLDVDREVLRTYLECSYLKAQLRNSKVIADLVHLLSKETERFVRSGQRSVIERYLVDAEAEEADTRMAEFTERVGATERRLAIELGQTSAEPVHCVDLPRVETSLASLEQHSGTSPVIEAQQQRVHVAEARLERARAESRPEISALITGGYFDNQLQSEKFNYSAGIGISVPLFTGFKLESHIDREQADLNAEEAGLAYSRQAVDTVNSRYSEQTQSLRVRLTFLDRENRLAKTALELARKRFLDLQGTMVDLRDTIKNMTRVLQSTDEAYRDLYTARGEASLMAGARSGD